jgi:hypothetical protein
LDPISASERHHAPDHPQEVLRDALRAAYRDFSPERILRKVESSGFTRPFTKEALKAFIHNITVNITPKNYEPLAAVWLRNVQGRSLRYIDASAMPEFDKLTSTLASGQQLRPHGATVTGRYFLYHGSYIAEKHYVIRLVEVACIDDSILAVTDTIRDNLKQRKELIAHGALTFIKDQPQFLFNANENKAGLSLIAGTNPVFNDANEFESMTGAFLAVTSGLHVAERSCFLVRETVDDRATMIAQSGIFTRAEVQKQHPKHHAAFDTLARLPPTRVFTDPMADYLIEYDIPRTPRTGRQARSK